MNKRLKIKMVLMICLATVTANAQRVLTLDECHRLALENNKELKVAEEEVNKARYEMYSSYANYLPKLEATGSYMHNSKSLQLLSDENIAALNSVGTMTQAQIDAYKADMMAFYQSNPEAYMAMLNDPTMSKILNDLMTLNEEDALNQIGQQVSDAFNIDTRNVYAGTITIQQPVFAGGKILAYNQITKDLKELAESKLEMQQQETVATTDKAYWQIVSIANKLKLAESYTETLRSLSNDMDKMVAEGVATTSDQLSVKVKLNEAETALLKAQNGLALSKMLLCRICGLPLDSNIVLADENLEDVLVTNSHPSYSESDVEANRPELKCLSIANDIYAKKVWVTRADYLPTIGAFGNYVVSNPSCFNGFQNEFGGLWNFGVMAQIPIFHWGEGYNKTRMAKTEAKIQQYKYEDSKEMIMLQVRQCEKQLGEADARMRLTQEKLNDADENLRMATAGFREGVVESSVIDLAQTAWLQAHSDYIDAKIDRIMAEVNLRKAAGVNLK
jgi:outer membrane protein TolC